MHAPGTKPGTPCLLLVADDDAAISLGHALGALQISAAVITEDSAPYAEVALDPMQIHDRLTCLAQLTAGTGPRAVVASVVAALRRSVTRDAVAAASIRIVAQAQVAYADLLHRLVRAGYQRVPLVDEPGSFAARGEVVDIYPAGAARPVRLEFFGDTIERLRWFDAESQRSLGACDELVLHPISEIVQTQGSISARVRAMVEDRLVPSRALRQTIERLEASPPPLGVHAMLPAFHDHLEALIEIPFAATLLVEPERLAAVMEAHRTAAEREFAALDQEGILRFLPSHVWAYDAMTNLLATTCESIGRVSALGTTWPSGIADHLTLRQRLAAAHDVHKATLRREINDLLELGTRVIVCADTDDRAVFLRELIDQAWGERYVVAREQLDYGFWAPDEKLALLGVTDVFAAKPAPRARRTKAWRGLSDFAGLVPGDYLVHRLHGVGRFRGLTQIPNDFADPPGELVECVEIEYLDGQVLVPVYRLHEIERFLAHGGSPRMDRIGGATWAKTKAKAEESVQALAEELLQLYAKRALLTGHRFGPSSEIMGELERGFPYEETPDQRAAIAAVLADMESPRAMDRLVCGDVGFGKTEVAMRAIFKCALGGKQAALLAPTTLLVEQHARTLRARLADVALRVETLSRFTSRKETDAILSALADGRVDIVIGTHRLLSADVRFADLGLVVVDEEQRFGVAHKERLKAFRANVDVLSLSATPIPRTLHLALTGLRDLSLISTPPTDRRAVRTLVASADARVVKEALEAELARGGQAFFISPFIDGGDSAARATRATGIHEWREFVQELVPSARIGVAHGELSEAALEEVMRAFVSGELDILVATTIVEAGLDIPRANTIFIAEAHRFGMAQLYQLRGRVGRSSERAYCYLLVPDVGTLQPEARARLSVLSKFSELGSGFHIASHDLELRGGGELLGARQSGTLAAVGFETYVTMLERAVKALRKEPLPDVIEPDLRLADPGFIPEAYLPDPELRLVFYRRLAAAKVSHDVDSILAEMVDRFGALTDSMVRLGEHMHLRVLARKLGVTSLEVSRRRLAIGASGARPWLARALALGWQPLADGRLAFDVSTGAVPRRLLETLANKMEAS